MAENKVTTDVESRECDASQVSGSDGVLNTVRGELLPFIVEQLKSSLERGSSSVPASAAVVTNSNGDGNGGDGNEQASVLSTSESSEDGPAFDSGTESGDGPRTPSSQMETQDECMPDGSEFSCFMEGLKSSFDTQQSLLVDNSSDGNVADLPPDIIRDVHSALAKLRGSLQIASVRGEIVDSERSEALLSLITRLQNSLQKQDTIQQPPVPPPWKTNPEPTPQSPPIPAPRKKKPGRHTVDVTREDLDNVRQAVEHQDSYSTSTGQQTPSSPGSTHSSFRPVHFSPMRSPSLSSLFNTSAKPYFQHQEPPKPAPRPFQLPLVPKNTFKLNKENEQKDASCYSDGNNKKSKDEMAATDYEVHGPIRAMSKTRPRAASCSDDPSLSLFTPAENVQIAIHKAAINKQLSLEECSRKRESKTPDIFIDKTCEKNLVENVNNNENKFTPKDNIKNSHDLDPVITIPANNKPKLNLNIASNIPQNASTVIWGSILTSTNVSKDGEKQMSSAKKLLEIASNKLEDVSPTSSRSSRSEKRRKMKRANTIDIPKPLHMIDIEDSGDEFESDCENESIANNSTFKVNSNPAGLVPFVPKTENDKKFLAFLERRSPVADTKPAFCHRTNSSDNHWASKFSNIKTNFEQPKCKKSAVQLENHSKFELPARKFWSNTDDTLSGKTNLSGPRISRQSSSNLRKMYAERDLAQKSKLNLQHGTPETPFKPPWAISNEPVVVVGSLTVTGGGNGLACHSVQARRQLFSVEKTPPLLPAKKNTNKQNTTPSQMNTPQPKSSNIIPQKDIKQVQLMKWDEIQRQQQLQFMQQKQEQQRYCQKQAQKQFSHAPQIKKLEQTNSSPTVVGPAPISKFSHAQNSAFRPPEKRSILKPTIEPFSVLSSTSLVQNAKNEALLAKHNQEDGLVRRVSESESSPMSHSLNLISKDENPVMMTAVTRVMAAPMSQQAVVTNKVKRRDTDFEAPRSQGSAAKNLSAMLQRFSEPDEGDTYPELCISPIETDQIPRRNYGLNRSSHSTSDMHNTSFQERFSAQNSTSSGSSSIGRFENPVHPSPLQYISSSTDTHNREDDVVTMRLQIPFVQSTTTPSPTFYPTQHYQAQYNSPNAIFSPLVQRRNLSDSGVGKPNETLRQAGNVSPRNANNFSPLRKSESCHQLAFQKQRPHSLALPSITPPTRRSPNSKAHLFSKQFEARMSVENVDDKQRKMEAYLHQGKEMQQQSQQSNVNSSKTKKERVIPTYSRQDSLRQFVNEEDFENVDEAFESLFNDAVKSKRTQNITTTRPPPLIAQTRRFSGSTTSSSGHTYNQHAWEESSGVRTELAQIDVLPTNLSSLVTGKQSESTVISTSDNSTRKEVHMKTSSVSSSMTSTTRVSKAAPPSKLQMSPFAKFKQLDEQNSSPSPSSPQTPGGSSVPLFKFTDAGLSRSASNVKEKLLYWCQVKTKEYKDLKIENFSTSWSNGLAFCALIHHFGPEHFDYYVLRPEKRRKNFELAFKVADEKFDIAPLLDVDDMVMMKKPDWKCVFTYVQSIYRRFKDELD